MTFRIEYLRVAENDLAEAAAFIGEDSKTAAERWLKGIVSAIDSLGNFPLRHPVIREHHEVGRAWRSFPFHSHRVVYAIDETNRIVRIVRIYHSARSPLQFEDIPNN